MSIIAMMLLTGSRMAAQTHTPVTTLQRPKLVVGIVVDQMRWDYLYRYQKHYTEGGFRRMLSEGYTCENTALPYVPSVTAIGHTCIYTGSVPSIHGIAGNNFVKDGQKVYCTDDKTVKSVGSTSDAGLMSPQNLWTTTIGDEMRIASNGRAKVVGVSLKDRASILPAGHNPNGAYWFDDATGRFITSTYYMDKLPQWVRAFNDKHLPERYLSADWNTLYPKATYAESTADDTPYENGIREGVKPMLPLPLPALYRKYGYGIIRNTPFGNTLTLDQALADFLAFLDQKVGRGNYLVFLTADHGAMNNARFLQDRRIPADSWDSKAAARKLREALAKDYPQTADLIKTVMNYQVFLNVDAIRSARLDASKVKERVVSLLQQDPDVLYACDMEKVATASIPDEVKYRIINGYNRERSGSVAIVLKPNHYDHGMKGTDHGTWNPYDTHIPLVFMGWGIQHGSTTRPTYMTDIAPTIAALLHVQAPNGNIGRPIFGAEQ